MCTIFSLLDEESLELNTILVGEFSALEGTGPTDVVTSPAGENDTNLSSTATDLGTLCSTGKDTGVSLALDMEVDSECSFSLYTKLRLIWPLLMVLN